MLDGNSQAAWSCLKSIQMGTSWASIERLRISHTFVIICVISSPHTQHSCDCIYLNLITSQYRLNMSCGDRIQQWDRTCPLTLLVCSWTTSTSKQNHRTVWVGKDLTDHLVPSPCRGQRHLPLAQVAQIHTQKYFTPKRKVFPPTFKPHLGLLSASSCIFQYHFKKKEEKDAYEPQCEEAAPEKSYLGVLLPQNLTKYWCSSQRGGENPQAVQSLNPTGLAAATRMTLHFAYASGRRFPAFPYGGLQDWGKNKIKTSLS